METYSISAPASKHWLVSQTNELSVNIHKKTRLYLCLLLHFWCSHSPTQRPLTSQAHVIMIWLYRRVYGTEVGPPLVCLLILGREKKSGVMSSTKAPGDQTNYLQCRVQELTTCPQPPSHSASVSDIPQWMSGNKMDFSPAVNRISYLSVYPTKLFTLYTATPCVI